jgi:unsaturated chondroitin disaccharide hydrolase
MQMKIASLINFLGSVLVILLLFSFRTNTTYSKNSINFSEDDVISKKTIDVIFKKTREHLSNSFSAVKEKGKLPRSIEKGFVSIDDWTSGFYPGSLWLAFEYTQEKSLLEKARYATELLEEEKYNTSDHDIGFRIYCSYGKGYSLTKNPAYQEVIIQAANSAIQRYSPKVKAIMSWNPKDKTFETRNWQFPVIIDNMMNLELLFAATRFTQNSKYYDIAVNHAVTTMKNQFREDYSCSHVVDYDSISGVFRKRDWNNGHDDPNTAAWSRGQSWGLYSYTMVYRETREERFLKQAESIADYIISNKNMPQDMVPYWDYRAPQIPTLRDASAAAILASGLLELSQLSRKSGVIYFNAAEKILKSLSSPHYFAEPGTNGNFLLKHATGNFVRNSEKDGTLIYADYYFLEGLSRYAAIKKY